METIKIDEKFSTKTKNDENGRGFFVPKIKDSTIPKRLVGYARTKKSMVVVRPVRSSKLG